MKKILTILFCSFPLFIHAQTDSPLSYWNTTLHIGAFVNDVPKHLEEAMRSNGFGHTDNGFLGSVKHPFSRELPILQLGIEKISAKVWSGKFLLSTLRGNVYGYSNIHEQFEIQYRLTTAAFQIGVHTKQRILRIALGPALNLIHVKTDRLILSPTVSHQRSSKATLKTGLIGEAGVCFPARSRLFLDFHTQYQIVIGKQDFGTYPFESTDVIGQVHRVEFQGGKKSFSNLSLNFGIGLRFGEPLK